MTQDSAGPAQRSVFVVDDDDSVACGLVRLLRAGGYAARSFPSAAAFLAEPSLASWDCGLIDCQMPGMDGFALAEHLRDTGAPPPAVVMMTGRPTEQVRARAAAASAASVIAKPLAPDELLNAVRLALAA